ncbi:MAG: methionyl-tRNA formyltransferase [Oscillospiraceae bacterium]|nr:methionyl-tRNA formyltransferase [Oscillospiraceae bacterium]
MNVVFMGTPDFAVPSLKAIAKHHNVLAVFTQPDKPVGRKMVLTPPDVKVCARELSIPVYQPVKLREGDNDKLIRELNPDVIVVVAYGQILPESILNIPRYGCINVHGSLLPKYRGAAPIQWSVLNGDEVTGVTTMYMEKGLDTGDILLTEEYKIGINETAGQVFDNLSELGGELIIKTLDYAQKGMLKPVKQDDSLSTYAKMLDKSMCKIDFSKTNKEVHNKVRGLCPWPVASTVFNGKILKIFETRLADGKGKPGEVICTNPLTVACGEGAVVVNSVQLQGKKRMDSNAFLQGHKISIGTIIGD